MAENVEDKVVTVGGLKAKHTYDETTYLKKSGDTMSGTLILTNANDASPTAYDTTKPPALVVGGAITAPHLEIDTNEILAKSSNTAPSDLFLNDDVVDTQSKQYRVGISNSTDIYNAGIMPRVTKEGVLKSVDIGAEAKPFNHMYGVNYNLFAKRNSVDTDFGALRVGKLDDDTPAAILELGNANGKTVDDKDVPVSSRITMYNGTTFTNIFANGNTSRSSNAVTLPQSEGTMLVYRASTVDISPGSSLAPDTLYLVYE